MDPLNCVHEHGDLQFLNLNLYEPHDLCSSMHYFEGPDWQHLKRGSEKFPKGPLVRADPQGRCAGVLVYNSQIIMLKAAQVCRCNFLNFS
jgi:hypothetical protein